MPESSASPVCSGGKQWGSGQVIGAGAESAAATRRLGSNGVVMSDNRYYVNSWKGLHGIGSPIAVDFPASLSTQTACAMLPGPGGPTSCTSPNPRRLVLPAICEG